MPDTMQSLLLTSFLIVPPVLWSRHQHSHSADEETDSQMVNRLPTFLLAWASQSHLSLQLSGNKLFTAWGS